jgi:hypothetical protein
LMRVASSPSPIRSSRNSAGRREEPLGRSALPGGGGPQWRRPVVIGQAHQVNRSASPPSIITDRLAPMTVARIAGGSYLGFIVASVLADQLAHLGLGELDQVYRAIVTDPWSFRLGLVIALVSAFLFLMAAWGLFVLLRRVDANLALLFLLLNVIGVAIQCAAMLPLLSALLLGDGASRMDAAFQPAQVQELTRLWIDVFQSGFVTAQLFYGTWLFPLGYLVYRSGFLPRFLGVLLLLDGVAVLIWFSQALLFPGHDAFSYPGLAVSFVAEVGLGLWLVIKGVKLDVGWTTAEGWTSRSSTPTDP